MPDPPKTPISMALRTPNDMLSGMPAVRKRLIVEGRTQGMGYRALVTFHARNLKVKGVVRNLPDETVEIICEADNETLKEFLKAIDQKGDPADNMSLHVAYIREAPPAPEGELGRFYTDYGRKLTELEQESKDREEMMVLRAGKLDLNMNVAGKNVLEVGQKVDSMHTDMNTRFDHMAQRYDLIATSLVKAIDRMDAGFERMDKNFERSRKETAAQFKQSRDESNRANKEIVVSNRELAKAVKFMITKLSDRPARKRLAGKRKR